jgi:hypothetical protein
LREVPSGHPSLMTHTLQMRGVEPQPGPPMPVPPDPGEPAPPLPDPIPGPEPPIPGPPEPDRAAVLLRFAELPRVLVESRAA